MYSDEDEDDRIVLLYLPISPEIEDVEESHAADQQVINYFGTPALDRCSSRLVFWFPGYRARQLYNDISMLFLFPVKDGKLRTGVNAQRFLSCYG